MAANLIHNYNRIFEQINYRNIIDSFKDKFLPETFYFISIRIIECRLATELYYYIIALSDDKDETFLTFHCQFII